MSANSHDNEFDPALENDFWLFSMPYARPTLQMLCAGSFVFPLLVAGIIIATKGAENVSWGAVSTLSIFPLGAVVIFFLTRHKNFSRFYRLLAHFVYVSSVIVFHAVAAVALETGRRAAIDAILIVAFAAVLLPVKLKSKAPVIAATFLSIAWAKHRYYGEPIGYLLAWSAILTFFVSMLGAFHDRSNRAAFRTKLRLEVEQRRSESLLRKIYPEAIYLKIKDQSQPHFVQHFSEVSILFADIVGFTAFCADRSPEEVVSILDEITSRLDASCAQVGAVKIKTVGDAYLAVTGLPDRDPQHAVKIADLAIEFREAVAKYSSLKGMPLQVRIGVHTGPVVAGIIGRTTSHFDLWGDTVNVASRLEASSLPGKIQVSEEFAAKIRSRYIVTERGVVDLKGKGSLRTFFLENPLVVSQAKDERMAA